MPESAAKATAKPRRRKAQAFTTTTIVSFSLTLLAGAIAVLTGLVPLRHVSIAERVDIGSVLFVLPVLALVLAVVFEAARIALTRSELPAPRQKQTLKWTPGRREG
jgi:hypothetical protein